MSILYGFFTAIGPALFMLGGVAVLRHVLSRSTRHGRPSRGRRVRAARHVVVPLAAGGVGALIVAVALGFARGVDAGWALIVMGAAVGVLVGLIGVASLDEADPLGAEEEGWQDAEGGDALRPAGPSPA